MPEPVTAPKQNVPAWRVARLGLPSPAYPMEYWMNVHGALLRTAALAHDDFLRDVAHWGMTGRFGNYPGDNRSKVSLVAELPEAQPLLGVAPGFKMMAAAIVGHPNVRPEGPPQRDPARIVWVS